MGYRVHDERVWAYHRSPARIRIVTAPARTSKSYAAAHDAVVEGIPPFVKTNMGRWRPTETRLTWIVGADYATNKEFDYIHQIFTDSPLREMFTVESAVRTPAQGNLRVILDLGQTKKGKNTGGRRCRAIFEGKSSQNERSLQGEEVWNVVLSEAAEHEAKIWDHYLATRTTRATWPTTPKIRARWIKNHIDLGMKDPTLGIESFAFPPDANPDYDWDRFNIEKRKAEERSHTGLAEDDPWFAEQFLGRWVFYGGRVLPFSRELHIQKEVDALPSDVYFWCFDYGYTDPFVGLLCKVDRAQVVTVLDEFYETQLSGDEVLERIKAIEDKHGVRPKMYIPDPMRPQTGRLLRDRGLPVLTINGKRIGDRAAGFRRLVDQLSVDPMTNRPNVLVHDRCQNLIREMEHIHRREGSASEYTPSALKGDDHAIDALRYGLMATMHLRAKERGYTDWYKENQKLLAKRLRESKRSVYHRSLVGRTNTVEA